MDLDATSVGEGGHSSFKGSGSTPATRPSASRPALVSIVIPVLNQGPYIGAQLESLSRQTYAGDCETIVVDNGSTDDTVARALEFRDRLPGLRVVDASGHRGVQHARNVGARAAQGDFLALCDGDDVVAEGWLEGLVKAAADADIVGGPIDVDTLNSGLPRAWRQDEPLLELAVKHDFLPTVSGSNCGMWTSVARELGFDAAWRDAGADIEFSWRANLAGYRMVYAPDAFVCMRFRTRMWAMVRQWYGYGTSGPRLYRQFRSVGMAREPVRPKLDELRWLARHLRAALRDPAMRGRWLRVAAFRAGRLTGSVRWRVWFP
jgi:glycosyltransferase involved in cell wall biosynthesis